MTSYEDALERIFLKCKGMTLHDVDHVLLVTMMANTDAAIMYQAARNLDDEAAAIDLAPNLTQES
jgi:hypothetical protein